MSSSPFTLNIKLSRFWKYLLKYGVPLVVTVLLCILLFRDINLDEIATIISSQCHFGFIGLMLVISVFSHIFRAMRWRLQLRALDIDAPLFPLILSIFGTYAVNLVLPRLGELWRTGYIARRQNAPFASVFGSMVADRMADTVTVLLLTIITFFLAAPVVGPYLSDNSSLLSTLYGLATSPVIWCLAAVFIVLVWMFLRRPSQNRYIVKIKSFLRGLWQGFAVVATMRGHLQWLVLTVAIWGCYFIQMYVAFYAFDFTADIISRYGILAVLVTFVLSSIAMGVPSNGGIGPWQWAVICALGMYGLEMAPASAFANLVMGCNTLLIIVLGLFTFVCIALDRRNNPTPPSASTASIDNK